MPSETQALTLHAMTIPPGQRGRRLITTGGVARIAGCDTATVRRAIFRGELQALRLGKRGDYPSRSTRSPSGSDRHPRANSEARDIIGRPRQTLGPTSGRCARPASSPPVGIPTGRSSARPSSSSVPLPTSSTPNPTASSPATAGRSSRVARSGRASRSRWGSRSTSPPTTSSSSSSRCQERQRGRRSSSAKRGAAGLHDAHRPDQGRADPHARAAQRPGLEPTRPNALRILRCGTARPSLSS